MSEALKMIKKITIFFRGNLFYSPILCIFILMSKIQKNIECEGPLCTASSPPSYCLFQKLLP